MRVLVLGTAGTKKRAYIDAVQSIYLQRRHGVDSSSTHAKHHARVVCVEDEIAHHHDDSGTTTRKHHLTSFLDLPRQSQLNRWTKSTDRILDELADFGKQDEEVLFFLVHGEFYRHRQLFSCFSWDQLLRLAPDVIVTLIDDAYDIRERINRAERTLATKSLVTLPEVL